MTFADEKRKRVLAILKYIVENPGISRDKLIGRFCLEWGLRYQKVQEYLSELEALGLIKLEPQVGFPSKFDIMDYLVSPTEEGKAKIRKVKREDKHGEAR
jgi:DNA-binding MarR family transcriptional regulator